MVGSFHEPRQPAWSHGSGGHLVRQLEWYNRERVSRWSATSTRAFLQGCCRFLQRGTTSVSCIPRWSLFTRKGHVLALRTCACDQLWRLIDPWTLLETLPGSLSRVSPSSSLLPHPFSLSSWSIISPLQSLRTVRCEFDFEFQALLSKVTRAFLVAVAMQYSTRLGIRSPRVPSDRL